MGAKSGLEYVAKEASSCDYESLSRLANDMAGQGWTLVTCVPTAYKWKATLMFSRPRPKPRGKGA